MESTDEGGVSAGFRRRQKPRWLPVVDAIRISSAVRITAEVVIVSRGGVLVPRTHQDLEGADHSSSWYRR